MKLHLHLTEFSAGDVERVTGLSTGLQRDWRRRGYLPTPEEGARAKFNVFTLSQLWVMQMLSEHGIGPAVSSRAAEYWGLCIADCALRESDAYGGRGFNRLFEVLFADFAPVRIGEPTDLSQIQAHASYELQGINPEHPTPFASSGWRDESAGYAEGLQLRGILSESWAATFYWLRQQAIAMHPSALDGNWQRYLIWWPGDRYSAVGSIDEAFRLDAERNRVHAAGRAFVLDAASLSHTLLHRAGKPLITVDIEDSEAAAKGTANVR